MTHDSDASHRIGLIEPDRVRIWEDEFHVLHLQVDDDVHDDIRPVRAFPVSAKANYIGFLDDEDKEVALVPDPDRLDPESRQALEAAVARMYYVPKITRVDAISESWGVSHWNVQTDRGYAVFEVVTRENIRKLPNGRFLLQDADGNRFEIENVSDLDSRSQALVQSET